MPNEIWRSNTGVDNPQSKSDIEAAFDHLLESRRLMVTARSKGARRRIAREVWDLASGDIGKIVAAVEQTLEAKAGYKYLKTCLANSNGNKGERVANFPAAHVPVAGTTQGFHTADISWDKLYRSEFDHWTWLDSRRPWVGKMWLDLCHYYPRPWDREIYFAGQRYLLAAGTVLITERQLSERQRVTRDQIHRLLIDFERDGMILKESLSKQTLRPSARPSIDPVPAPVQDPVKDPVRQSQNPNRITLITICNYWKYHTKIEDKEAAEEIEKTQCKTQCKTQYRPSIDPAEDPHIREVIQENKRIETPTPPTPSSKDFIEAFEKHRGRMESLVNGKLGDCTGSKEILNLITGIMRDLSEASGGDLQIALTKWIEVVTTAGSQTHPSHDFIQFKWLAKSIVNCHEVLSGKYNRSFEEGNRGSARGNKQPGKGSPKHFERENLSGIHPTRR